jgi:hypothetical protein
MKAIITKYHGPTDTRGSRISAKDEDGNRVSIPYRHDLNQLHAHTEAAISLCTKMGWTGRIVAGGIKGGFAFVFTDADVLRYFAQRYAKVE